MPSYHNQTLIRERYEMIVADIVAGNNTLDTWIHEFEQMKDEAQRDVDHISEYTAPEEIKNRRQSLCYYVDVIERLEKLHDAAEYEAEIKRGK